MEARVEDGEVIPDHGNAENEGIDSVEHTAVAGEQSPGIFHSCGTLACGFEEISHLASDIAECCHCEQMKQ